MRSPLLAGFAFLLAAVAPAGAEPGVRGTVTAYDIDSRTVLEHRVCFRHASGAYDYVACGERLREDIKTRLCTTRGAGTHHYYYQIGETKPMWSSVYCPRR